MLNRLSIRGQLLAIMAVFGLGLTGFGIYAYLTLDTFKVNGPHYLAIVQGKDLIADILPPPEYILETHLVAYQMSTADANGVEALAQRFEQLRKDYDTRHEYWLGALADGEIKDVLLKDSFEPADKYYKLMASDYIPAIRKGDKTAAAAKLAELSGIYDQHRAAIDRVVSLETKDSADKEQNVASAISTRATILVLLGVVTLALGCTACLWLGRSIVGALQQALGFASRISEGNLAGDIQVDSSNEIGRLLTALKQMKDRLFDVVRQVKDSTGTISHAAREIASGNMDLSQRTEQQASSLEETASAMEQMTSTVKMNSDNARHANQLANATREQADLGGQVVNQAITAMAEISTASNQIANIIGVIDEIAFQTNLLALNAAVEAARAGEQGRGFAVVATEVRNLAQRSATAAKEIKTLIQDSVAKVNAGSELVNRSGATLTEIVVGAKKVSDIVAEIAAASAEQATGIDEVGKAVMQMDNMTQQNAALVEQAAAAAKEMENQSNGLEDLMRFFKTDGGATASAPRVATTASLQRMPASRPAAAPQRPVQNAARAQLATRGAAAPQQRAVATPAPSHGEVDKDWEEF